jgi:hypothetical protein
LKVNKDFGLMGGRYPASIASYDPHSRLCRIHINGLTDGCETLPLAEIEYPIGDKSKPSDKSTEIEMVTGDTVWIAFIGGDQRYPIITGYRNPTEGNSVGWRRFHHENIELLAAALLNIIAESDILLKSNSKITLQAPEVFIDSPSTSMTGDALVQKALAFLGGMTGSGGSAGGPSAVISGGMEISEDVVIAGKSFLGHTHMEQGDGNTVSPPI